MRELVGPLPCPVPPAPPSTPVPTPITYHTQFWHEAIRVVVKLEKGSAMAAPLYQQFVDADRLLCNTMAAFSIPPFPRFPANPNPI